MKIGNIEVYGVIYKITNIINGKCYIGQTVNGFNRRYWCQGIGIEKVYNYYKYEKTCNRYVNEHLFNSIEKYGFDAFEVIEIFDIAFSKKELNIKENCYIKLYNSNKKEYGYNITEGGEGMKGWNPSEETRKKMSETHKGENHPMYGVRGEDNPLYGKHRPQEVKDKISKAHKGKILSDETKKKISENNARFMLGKHHTEETRKKMSESKKGENNPMFGKRATNVVSVICITTKRIFNSITEGAEYYKCPVSSVKNCCDGYRITKGKRKSVYSAGKHPVTNEKLKWKYLIWKHNKKFRIKK